MDKVRSLYLDFLRIAAAFYVFIYHFGYEQMGKELYFSNDSFKVFFGLQGLTSHYFVIVFFVLSGFLITMSVSKPGITFRSFMVARLGRLYSVLIPALLFSFLVAFILIRFNLVPVELVKHTSNPLLRFVLNLFFLAQSWSLYATPPFNEPFWSISYEFMYYLLIASTLINNRSKKILFIIIVLLLAGYKIILLAPAWFIGNFLYKIRDKNHLGLIVNIILFAVSSALLTFFVINPYKLPLARGVEDNMLFGNALFHAWNFRSDYLFALLFSLNIFTLFGISKNMLNVLNEKIIKVAEFTIRPLSNCSFTLYMFHVPLLYFFASILPYDKTSYLQQFLLMSAVLLSVYLIARQTEWRVDYWRKLIDGVLQKIIDFTAEIKKNLRLKSFKS